MALYEMPTWAPLLGAVAFLIVGAVSLSTSHNASATPQLAKETGKACSQCHQDPKGGGQLTPFGAQFKANGNKLPTKADETPKANETPPLKPAT